MWVIGSVLAETNVVVSVLVTLFPLTCVIHCTAAQGRIGVPSEDVPSTLSANVGEPTRAEVGSIEVIAGARRPVAGVVMVKVREFEGPVAVETETDAVPGYAISVGRIEAVTCVVLANVVTRGKPFQFTVVAPFTKFVPFTVSVIPFGWQ
jgi:hypothetical protein